MKITSITYPEGFSGDWRGGAILAEESQKVKVTFSPTEVKDYTGMITITSDAANAASGGTSTLDITGKGVLITALEPARAAESGKDVFPVLSIFPNPAADVLNIKLPNQTRPVALQLVDVNGQVVYERKAVTTDELSIDVSVYRSGVYVLALQTPAGKGSKVAKWRVMIK